MPNFMLKNKKIILIVLFVLILLGLSGWLIYFPKTNSENISPPRTQITQNIVPSTKITELSFTDTDKGVTSAYDFMSKLRNERKINFTEKTYTGMGKFIDSINGINGNGAESWIYYVNGIEAQVGVSNYKINKGDVISWKYEKANY